MALNKLINFLNGHITWGTGSAKNIGAFTGAAASPDLRPNNIFTAGLIASGNIFGLTPGSTPSVYGLNGPASIVGGFVLAGNGPSNVVAAIGSSSLLNAIPQGFLGFVKDTGTANVPAFFNSNTLADWDIFYSVGHRSAAREDILQFGYEGSIAFLKPLSAAPSNPVTGLKLFFQTDGNLYSRDSSGTQKQFTSLVGGVLSSSLSLQPGTNGGLTVGGNDSSSNNYSITLGDSVMNYFADPISPSLTWNLGAAGAIIVTGNIQSSAFVTGAAIQGSAQVVSQGLLVEGLEYLVATEGGSDTATAVSAVVLDPAGALTAYTLVMPSGILNGQLFTISSTQNIATFTLTPAASQTLAFPPTAMVAGTPLRYIFRLVGMGPAGVWYPV